MDFVIIHLAPTLLLIRNVHKPARSHKRYIAQGSCANVAEIQENCEVVWGLAGNIVRAAADLNCLPFLPSLELQASGDHCLFLLHQPPGMPFTSKVESKLICVCTFESPFLLEFVLPLHSYPNLAAYLYFSFIKWETTIIQEYITVLVMKRLALDQ